MKLAIRYAGLSDAGRVRSKNEDHWAADLEQNLFIVTDGMGGEFAGALASQIVVETLPGLVQQHLGPLGCLQARGARRRMAKAIATLSTQMRQQTQNQPGLEGMGSTVVCVLVRGEQLLVAHMGDSRAYRLREGRLKQLTKDHSLVQLLLDSGEISPEQAPMHPARGRLTRNVGMEGEPLPQVRQLQLKAGDLLLLCTDGLTGMVDDQTICSILKEAVPLETRCQHLVSAANEAGGNDNITVVLLEVAGRKKTTESSISRTESKRLSVSNTKSVKTNKRTCANE